MRVFTISDLHLDYAPNREWVQALSLQDYQHDVLILAGDLSDRLSLLIDGFGELARRFSTVLFVPGNHDLWVHREDSLDSLEKFEAVCGAAAAQRIRMDTFRHGDTAIVPMLGWYDYSFGEASDYLREAWADFRACRWPDGFDDAQVTQWFTGRNPVSSLPALEGARKVITFSHFLPRIDLMPERIPAKHQRLYPILGTTILDHQIRSLGSSLHMYGHSHVNRRITVDGITYINNALGYPSEAHFTTRELVHVHTIT